MLENVPPQRYARQQYSEAPDRALLNERDLLFAGEPAGNLDSNSATRGTVALAILNNPLAAHRAASTPRSDHDAASANRANALSAKNIAIANAADAHTIQNYANKQHDVVWIYMGLRGSYDLPGVAYWMKNHDQNKLISQLMPGDSSSSAFVTSLYNSILGRRAASKEISYWANAIDNGTSTRVDVAKNILFSTEATTPTPTSTSRVYSSTSSAMGTINRTVAECISAETTAIENYDNAAAAVEIGNRQRVCRDQRL